MRRRTRRAHVRLRVAFAMLTQHRRPSSEPEFEYESGTGSPRVPLRWRSECRDSSLQFFRPLFRVMLELYIPVTKTSLPQSSIHFSLQFYLFFSPTVLILFNFYRGTGNMHRQAIPCVLLQASVRASVCVPTQDRTPECTRACAGT